MEDLLAKAHRVAQTDASVLILGESGTGKELLAARSTRRARGATAPFVAINCGAIPEQLLESELFGHAKGSFTGATRDHIGLFQAADKRHALPRRDRRHAAAAAGEAAARAPGARGAPGRLARATSRSTCASSRRRTATSRAEMARGQLPRGSLLPPERRALQLPPLAERREDIPLLANHFLRRIARARQHAPKSRLRARGDGAAGDRARGPATCASSTTWSSRRSRSAPTPRHPASGSSQQAIQRQQIGELPSFEDARRRVRARLPRRSS